MLKDADYEGAKDSSKGLMVGMLGDIQDPLNFLVRECSLETFASCWRLFCVPSLLTYSPGILSSAEIIFF